MATLKFLVQSIGKNKNIYIRLSIDRNNVFKRKTNFAINSADWNHKSGFPYTRTESLKNLKTDLGKLKTNIEERYNKSVSKGAFISGQWLQDQINNT